MNLTINIQADKARNLKLTPISAMMLEKEYKMSVTKYINSISEKVMGNELLTDEVITLLWLELRWENKELTKEECFDIFEKLLEQSSYHDAIDKLLKCLFYYIGYDDEKLEELEKNELSKQKKVESSQKNK